MYEISRTKKKKEAQSFISFGEKLVSLPIKEIESFDLPTEIYNAIKFAKTIKSNGAFRRQIKHIGGLILDLQDDLEPAQQKALVKLGMIEREKESV